MHWASLLKLLAWNFLYAYIMLGLPYFRFLLTKILEYHLKSKPSECYLKTLCKLLLQPRQLPMYPLGKNKKLISAHLSINRDCQSTPLLPSCSFLVNESKQHS